MTGFGAAAARRVDLDDGPSAAVHTSDTVRAPVGVRAGVGGAPVSIRGLARSFGERKVLQNLDLDLASGEFVAVVGRSGGGKSTLMRLVVGLDQANAGDILISGRRVDGLQANVRLLFQEPRLLPWKRVLQNVGIAKQPGWQEHARDALRDVGLGDRERSWPAVLSGGQRQRVALARVLVSRPEVLLLDEPFGALDALTRAEMHELLERVWLEHRFTTLLITHDVSEAVALADRVVVLRDGRIAFDERVHVARPRAHLVEDRRLADLRSRVLAAV